MHSNDSATCANSLQTITSSIENMLITLQKSTALQQIQSNIDSVESVNSFLTGRSYTNIARDDENYPLESIIVPNSTLINIKAHLDITESSHNQLKSNINVTSSANSKQDKNNLSEICWLYGPSKPFDLRKYICEIESAEYFHLYLWMIKDLAWNQDWYYTGMTFGTIAALWSLFLLGNALRLLNCYEICTCFSQFLWLFGNLWWVIGELHDNQFPASSENNMWLPRHTKTAGIILGFALSWLVFYYIVLRGHKEINIEPSPLSRSFYEEADSLKCRFLFVKTWREYENIHLLFWCGKDLAWNMKRKYSWIAFSIPTVLLSIDFVFMSLFNKSAFASHMHYIAEFVWVIANIVWAFGEMWFSTCSGQQAISTYIKSSCEIRENLRWVAGIIITFGLSICALLYVIWLPLTFLGKIHRNNKLPTQL